ncbi:MAG: CRISPR-associated protein Cas4 [Candidatus Thermoplasmatota archaeon]
MYAKTRSIRNIAHIPTGRVTYTDLNKPSEPLYSNKYSLAGKPDYIIKKHGHFIPVEVKTGSYKKPYKSHILQLAAYCQIIEDAYNVFVPYGILIYNDASYKIPFNPTLRFELKNVINEMRQTLLSDNNIELNHHDPNRCYNCSMSKYCKNKLI